MADNSMINALQQCSKSMWASTADVNINVGNGHSLMNIAGNDVSVKTGCGNQNVTALAMTVGEDIASLFVETGHCGEDTINGTSQGTATIKTKDSNDTIKLIVAGLFDVDAGVDATESTDDDFVTIYGGGGTAENKNRVSMGFGENDRLITYADNVDVEKGYGALMMGSIGSNYTVNSLATSHTIGGYGSGYQFNLENDNNTSDDIRSLDYWMEDGVSTDKYTAQLIRKDDNSGSFALKDVVQILDKDGETKISLSEYDNKYNSETVAFFKEQLGELFNSATAVAGGTYTTDPVQTESYETIDLDPKTDPATFDVEKIITKYNLNETQANALRSVNLSETLSDGSPKYALIDSVKYGGYVLIEKTGTKLSDSSSDSYTDGKVVSDGTTLTSQTARGADGQLNRVYYTYDKSQESGDSRTKVTTDHEKYKIITESSTTYSNAHIVGNLANWTINGAGSNNGSTNVIASVASGELTVNKGTDLTGAYTNKNIFNYIGGHINSTGISINSQEISRTLVDKWSTFEISEGGIFNLDIGAIGSPLILDMNGDGVVSAKAGMGVDINNDGKADGAATNGDKMLAMSDMNGNSKIDGAEVFGDQTISPFTGEKLNAANGFEALEMIAKEAEKYTGIKCIDGSNVDVQKLAEALATKGIKLGFISDNNVTELEDLAGVKTINTDDYEEVAASGDVQHRQLGSFTTENGETRKINDVWFKV